MKIYSILFILPFTLGCAEYQQNKSNIPNKEITNENYKVEKEKNSQKIILYMVDHMQSGVQETKDKNEAQYYRILIKNLGGNKFLVQDFFIDGDKQTDPYILTEGKIKYTYNENMGTSYYPREGDRIVWYKSGTKHAETHYKNNKEDGEWKTWYPNGNIKETLNYINGELVGNVKNWDENGKLVGNCFYKDGKKNGRCYAKYRTNPNFFIYDGYYENGVKIGVWKEWDENGKLTFKKIY